jgi:hypothetical protein
MECYPFKQQRLFLPVEVERMGRIVLEFAGFRVNFFTFMLPPPFFTSEL